MIDNTSLKTFDILVNLTTPNSNTSKKNPNPELSNLVEITQKIWLRPADQERWNLKDDTLLINKRDAIIDLLTQLGFISAVRPKKKHYDCVLILGALDDNLLTRIEYLKKLDSQEIKYKTVYLLSGNIPTTYYPNFEKIYPQYPNVKTETELMIKIFEDTHSSDKNELISVVTDKNPERANTKDTLITWLNEYGQERDILVISNQPFILYQKTIVEAVLNPKYYKTETVGDAIHSAIPIKIILDTCARYLYENLNSIQP